MQTEPLTVAGLAGPVVVTTNSFTGRNTVTVGGQPAALIARRRYALPAANGRTVEGTVSARFFDPYPTLELNGVRHRTGPEVPVALRILALVPIALAGLGGLVGAYMYLPHVRLRVDHFLDPATGDSYQVNRSIEAFANGGLWGRGPGEGTVKDVLPDAHADFVFAVAGEEFGVVVCLVIVALFAFIVLRGFSRMSQEGSLFVLLAATGLLVQFGLQAAINMASSLHLIPTKGMTLPFLSYGGSSMLALGLGMGMMLALTRRRLGGGEL